VSYDNTARVWEAATGKELARLEGHDGAVTSAAWSPDGTRIVTTSVDGTARLWRAFGSTQALVNAAKDQMGRCLTPAQRKQYFLPEVPPLWCLERRLWPCNTLDSTMYLARTKPASALILSMAQILALSADDRRAITLGSLKANSSSVGYPVATLYARRNVVANGITPCDSLASHPFDPLRIVEGVEVDDIKIDDAKRACDATIAEHPDQPRYVFNRARVWSKIANDARKAYDENDANQAFASAFADLQAAAAAGYPMAFNNLAISYQNGEGVAKDAAKAADLHLEQMNRTLACCFAAVARDLLAEKNTNEKVAIRAVTALLSWAAELNSSPARHLLAELRMAGTLSAAATEPPAAFTDLPPWLRD
jgi:hypothetical protein